MIPLAPVVASQPQPQIDTSCSSEMRAAAQTSVMPYESNMIGLAASFEEPASQTALVGLSRSFFSINQYWGFQPGCQSLVLQGVGVVFALDNSTGAQVGWLEIREDPSFSQITNASAYFPKSLHYPCNQNGNYCDYFDGWEFYGGSNHPPVLESEISFTEPTLSKPDIGCPSSGYCGISPWAGLENAPGGLSGLAQAGTDAVLHCTSSTCTQSDSGWYEQVPAWPVQCTPTGGITKGQTITVLVINEGAYSPPYTGKYYYDYTITDNTSGNSCTTTGIYYSTMNNPIYSSNIYEWDYSGCPPPNYSNQCDFPSFNPASPHGGTWYYYNGYYQLVGIYIPYQTGYYNAYNPMKNTCSQYGTVTNAVAGPPNSNSVWSATWYTSKCT